MRYAVLAADYDGTLATRGLVDEATLAALDRLKRSGRKLVLVTGRELEDLLHNFPQIDLFDRVVAENGAVVYCPSDRQLDVLGEAPPDRFVEALRTRGVSPLSIGRVIVATWEPHETIVLQTIRDLGLELQVIFNKGAVMVLPAGINKAVGLERTLAALHLSPHNAVGVGDAENDHAFLGVCEYAVAVANALPVLKERADWVTSEPRGAGVVELIDTLVRSDMSDAPEPTRQRILLGARAGGERLTISPGGTTVLIAGPSGSGKSTTATALLEQIVGRGYQACLVDPEGDYATFDDAVVLGDTRTPASLDEVLDVLRKPGQSVAAVLLGLSAEERPAFFDALMARLGALHAETGRPHWLVLDEAHYLAPADDAGRTPPDPLDSTLLITVHPDRVAPRLLAGVDLLLAVGPDPAAVIGDFARAAGLTEPEILGDPRPGAVTAWFRGAPHAFRFEAKQPHGERLRHRRKYAEGTLGPDKSFYFRGPEQKLQLRAQNLGVFLQLAEGVDDETWRHHLERGDYSRWVRESIKDAELADEIARVETNHAASAAESRAAIAEAIGRRYTYSAS